MIESLLLHCENEFNKPFSIIPLIEWKHRKLILKECKLNYFEYASVHFKIDQGFAILIGKDHIKIDRKSLISWLTILHAIGKCDGEIYVNGIWIYYDYDGEIRK
jgi:hypothetical protein